MTFERVAVGATVVLMVGCLLLTVLLVMTRVLRDRAERRRQEVKSSVWGVVLVLGSGEDDELDEAHAVLLAATPAQRKAVESDAFALLPKLRGASRRHLSEVLQAWGALDRARHSTTSRSAVRRCRGYYRLGVLAEPSRSDQVVGGLSDRDFIARRTAMLALGAFPDPEVVGPMVEATVEDLRLHGDFLASIDRIGAVAAPALREQLEIAIAAGDEGARRGQLVAEALGLVGAIEAVEALERAMVSATDEFRIACIKALGAIGMPGSIIALGDAVDHANADVRRAAAQALGLIGAGHAVELLASALEDDNVEVARAAANSLHRCGTPGRQALRWSTAPVALEARALNSLGATV
ncbi:MAG TPA: HEAT repeat domain-containing protein [Nocardioides sp.]|nr:HEAT repeat domain-containing protein [Nocardioides sp.]